MKIYLASPFFNENEIDVYDRIIAKLRNDGHNVYVPREHEQENAWDMSNSEWGLRTFKDDVRAIQTCDEVWVINFGMYSDSGTAWECGYAYGIGKPVRMVLAVNPKDTKELKVPTYSLMMINGCDTYDSIFNTLNGTNIKFNIEQK